MTSRVRVGPQKLIPISVKNVPNLLNVAIVEIYFEEIVDLMCRSRDL